MQTPERQSHNHDLSNTGRLDLMSVDIQLSMTPTCQSWWQPCHQQWSLQGGLICSITQHFALALHVVLLPLYLTALLTAMCLAQCRHDQACWETCKTEEIWLPKAQGLQQEVMMPLLGQLLQQLVHLTHHHSSLGLMQTVKLQLLLALLVAVLRQLHHRDALLSTSFWSWPKALIPATPGCVCAGYQSSYDTQHLARATNTIMPCRCCVTQTWSRMLGCNGKSRHVCKQLDITHLQSCL